jgi:hypothetical protein
MSQEGRYIAWPPRTEGSVRIGDLPVGTMFRVLSDDESGLLFVRGHVRDDGHIQASLEDVTDYVFEANGYAYPVRERNLTLSEEVDG